MNSYFAHAPAPERKRARFPHWLRRFAFLAINTFLLCGNAAAENAPAAPVPRRPMVEMEAKFVRATVQQMRAAGIETDIEGFGAILTPEQSEKILESLKKSGAEFFSNPRTLTRVGRRAVVEAVRELRYPVEYEPSKTELGKFLPTSFETRNVGVTIEFEPRIGPEGDLQIDLVPQIVNFRGFVDHSNQKPGSDPNSPEEIERLLKAPLKDGGIWHPIFAMQKLTTSVSIWSGQTVLIRIMGTVDNPSAGTLPGAPGQAKGSDLSNYVFITARVLTAE